MPRRFLFFFACLMLTAAGEPPGIVPAPMPRGEADNATSQPETSRPEAESKTFEPVDSQAEEPLKASDKIAKPLPPEPSKRIAAPEITAEAASEASVCEKQLEALGMRFTRKPAIGRKGGCGVASPLDIDEVAPGVLLNGDTELRCDAALALGQWMKESVLPASKSVKGHGGLREIRHAATYVCRRRNNAKTGKLSEHARGGAIDIRSFTFEDGTSITIQPRGKRKTDEANFQRRVRKESCRYFTTVLGPGSDGYHKDHLHLDVERRKGGYRLCR